jgi:peptide/nickel transport system substrate-binding protein
MVGFTGRAVLAGAVLSALLPFTATAQETPKRGGTLVFAITNGEPSTYDCHANSTTSILYRAAPHYSTLIKISQP